MRSRHLALLCGAATSVAVLAAGCGSSSPATAAPATTTTAAATSQSSGNATQSAAFQKFGACMTKHGVDVAAFGRRRGPTGAGTPPAGTPPPGSTTQTATPPGGANGNGSGPRRALNPKFQAALKACQSLAPQGSQLFGQGFGRRLGQGGGAATQQFQKFTACMKSHGVTLPTPGQQATTPVDRTSAAYKKASAACNKLLPGPGSGTASG